MEGDGRTEGDWTADRLDFLEQPHPRTFEDYLPPHPHHTQYVGNVEPFYSSLDERLGPQLHEQQGDIPFAVSLRTNNHLNGSAPPEPSLTTQQRTSVGSRWPFLGNATVTHDEDGTYFSTSQPSQKLCAMLNDYISPPTTTPSQPVYSTTSYPVATGADRTQNSATQHHPSYAFLGSTVPKTKVRQDPDVLGTSLVSRHDPGNTRPGGNVRAPGKPHFSTTHHTEFTLDSLPPETHIPAQSIPAVAPTMTTRGGDTRRVVYETFPPSNTQVVPPPPLGSTNGVSDLYSSSSTQNINASYPPPSLNTLPTSYGVSRETYAPHPSRTQPETVQRSSYDTYSPLGGHPPHSPTLLRSHMRQSTATRPHVPTRPHSPDMIGEDYLSIPSSMLNVLPFSPQLRSPPPRQQQSPKTSPPRPRSVSERLQSIPVEDRPMFRELTDYL
eukprot:CAMPEP_0174252760 /NCGR_PEP_ID=MMETSP0439-20130205/2132_1 /TAXON_ID=0 /ORGANISM="Stereomyxa ramosa, Strain Chinc5" /LENGTH=439 /DNA_ID=CAMNT_0015333375 /DNA_START=413 /DNA_END=1732 /DNA_ORIENTATION=-